jgi:uncharacterized damage-inducible protein DinB
MRTAEQMQSYARKCLAEAAQARTESDKRLFENLANDWAEKAEAQDWLDGGTKQSNPWMTLSSKP